MINMETLNKKNNYLLLADVMHKRLRPKENKFIYKVFYLCFPLRKTEELKNRFLSLDSFNLIGFYKKDHAKRDGSEIEPWIRDLLKSQNVNEADGDITLLTYPRVLGHVFNPVSFWFCQDKGGALRAVLAE